MLKRAAVLAVDLLEIWIIDTERNSLICPYTVLNVVHFFVANLQTKRRSEFEMLKLWYPQTYKANEQCSDG
jgi:hypothetical protein